MRCVSEADGVTEGRALPEDSSVHTEPERLCSEPGLSRPFLSEQRLTKTYFLLTINRTAAIVTFPSHTNRRERHST